MSRKSAPNDPVLRASEFCQAFLTWANACTTPLETDSTERREWRQEFTEHWKFMALAIYKSCMLVDIVVVFEHRAAPQTICPHCQHVHKLAEVRYLDEKNLRCRGCGKPFPAMCPTKLMHFCWAHDNLPPPRCPSRR